MLIQVVRASASETVDPEFDSGSVCIKNLGKMKFKVSRLALGMNPCECSPWIVIINPGQPETRARSSAIK